MRKAVVDSSVIVKWLNHENELHLEQADSVLRDVQSGKIALFTPELAKYEVGNALLKKGLTVAQAFQSLGTVSSLPIQFLPETEELAIQTYAMASEVKSQGNTGFTYYDAAFTALANQEKAILITDNPKHQAKVKNTKVLPLAEYRSKALFSKLPVLERRE